MYLLRLALAAIVLYLSAAPAQAISVTWTFQNALFSDQTSLTGSFDYDADIGGAAGFSNIDLVTQDGNLPGSRYNGGPAPWGSGSWLLTRSGLRMLSVKLADAMTNAGGSIDLRPSWTSGEGIAIVPIRKLVSGSITSPGGDGTVALAEPTSLIMVAMGMLALVVLRRRTIA